MSLRRLLDFWWVGPLLALLLALAFGYRMAGEDKAIFLPGTTSSGHHQIEAACNKCHDSFEGVKQETCLDCHGKLLETEMDSHAPSIFNDPRSFSMLDIVDASQCISCHGEHMSERNQDKIANVPKDFCFPCHQDIANERPSHKDFKADNCAASGCHNYHDNRALYEEFLAQHLAEGKLLDSQPRVAALLNAETSTTVLQGETKALTIGDQDGQPHNDPGIVRDWAVSRHALADVNCSDCHQPTDSSTGFRNAWSDQPSPTICIDCHEFETEGFQQGKHGMRLAAGLPPMKPRQARLPMKSKAHDTELNCNTCHSAHSYDTDKAAVDSCIGCHDDIHSKSYKGSPHERIWQTELAEKSPKGSGVSCATCHMPWTNVKKEGIERPAVMHNQNANLRPNSKMLRTVCMDCHGLGYSLNALADSDLLLNNYSGNPKQRVESLEMARKRQQNKLKKNTEASAQ